MTAVVSVNLLGPLQVCTGSRAVPLGGQKQQLVLLRLLVSHPEPVSAALLAEAVWGADPPTAWRSTLQAYVSRLRAALGEDVLVREASGYRLRLAADALDVARFRTATAAGAQALAASRFAQAANELADALALWRQPTPLGPAPPTWAEPFAAALLELRGTAVHGLASALIELGSHEEALGVLRTAEDRRWDEEVVGLRMRALAGAGRQVEALQLFEAFRRALDRELGLAPGPELRAVQLAVLRQDGPDGAHPRTPLPPRVLPPRVHKLLGRGPLLEEVTGLLATQHRVALVGLAGAGKSSLAAEVAHRHPGDVCWVPAGDETAALNALSEFAARLGVRRGLGRAEMLAALWAQLGEREDWLVVLDDAPHPEAALELLPPDPEQGRVLVTTLDPGWGSLAALVRVEPLSLPDATTFLVDRVRASGGGTAVDPGERVAAVELAELLGALPLGLEQACAYLDQTGMSLRRYVNLFRTRSAPLLERGAPAAHPSPAGTTWQLLFEAVRRRSPLAGRVLEVASFLSPEGVPWELLAPLAGEEELVALDAVTELMRCSLVDRDDAVLRVHRLVQAVVRDRLTAPVRRERAGEAVAVLSAAAPTGPVTPGSWPRWTALVPQVTALVRACAAGGVLPEGLGPLVLRCCGYLRVRAALPVAEALLDTAFELAETGLTARDGARGAEPAVRRWLVDLHVQRAEVRDDRGQLAAAREDLAQAVALSSLAAGDPPDLSWARTWSRLGHVLNCADQRAAASEYYEQALQVLRPAGEVEETATALVGLAYTSWGLDDYPLAERYAREAVELVEAAGWADHPLHPQALSALGMMLHEQGRCKKARRLQRQALAELRVLHGDADHPELAYVHDKLGWVEGLLGHPDRARVEHGRAVEILTRLFGPDDPRLAVALSNRGHAELAAGDLAAAVATQSAAHRLLVAAYGPRHRDTRLVAGRLREARRRSAVRQLDPVVEITAAGADDPQVVAEHPVQTGVLPAAAPRRRAAAGQ